MFNHLGTALGAYPLSCSPTVQGYRLSILYFPLGSALETIRLHSTSFLVAGVGFEPTATGYGPAELPLLYPATLLLGFLCSSRILSRYSTSSGVKPHIPNFCWHHQRTLAITWWAGQPIALIPGWSAARATKPWRIGTSHPLRTRWYSSVLWWSIQFFGVLLRGYYLHFAHGL